MKCFKISNENISFKVFNSIANSPFIYIHFINSIVYFRIHFLLGIVCVYAKEYNIISTLEISMYVKCMYVTINSTI